MPKLAAQASVHVKDVEFDVPLVVATRRLLLRDGGFAEERRAQRGTFLAPESVHATVESLRLFATGFFFSRYREEGQGKTNFSNSSHLIGY